MAERPVLIFNQGYLPGFKHGGPVRTLANLIERLGDEIPFRLVAADRDSGDAEPYAGIARDTWIRVGRADVFYASAGSLSLGRLRRLIRDARPGALYLNSFFAPTFTIRPLVLRRLGRLGAVPVVLAPRGEFSPGALALKPLKKHTFIAAARAAGLYRDVVWQASSAHEAEDIRRWFGGRARVVVAPDLTWAAGAGVAAGPRRRKVPGALRIVFLSRIVPKKNLAGALRLLDGVDGRIELTVHGPIEDRAYWARCVRVIERLPANVSARYRGPVPPDAVGRVFADHDLFLFPTLGENYGHVIIEALRAGCPVLISDRTPWRALAAAGAGWALPLESPERMREVLRRLVAMDDATHVGLSRGARAYAARVTADADAVESNRCLFRAVLAGRIDVVHPASATAA